MATVVLGALFVLALPSLAEISSVQPPSGSVTQGDSTSAIVTLTAPLGCVSATSSHPTIAVTLDGSATACGTGQVPWSATMSVQTTALTPVGSHEITIREIDLLGTIVDEHVWSLTVLSPTATTTLVTTTTTLVLTTTTVATTTTAEPNTTTTASPTVTTAVAVPTTTAPAPPGTTTTVVTTTTSPTTTTAATVEAGSGTTPPEEIDPVPSPFSEALRGLLLPLLPPAVLNVLLSPFLVIETIIRAVLDSGRALLLPIVFLGVVAGWAARRLGPWAQFSSRGPSLRAGFLSGMTALVDATTHPRERGDRQ